MNNLQISDYVKALQIVVKIGQATDFTNDTSHLEKTFHAPLAYAYPSSTQSCILRVDGRPNDNKLIIANAHNITLDGRAWLMM